MLYITDELHFTEAIDDMGEGARVLWEAELGSACLRGASSNGQDEVAHS